MSELLGTLDESLFTTTLPFVLIMVIIYRNHKITKKNIEMINNKCANGQGCHSCQRRGLCRKPERK